jgi:hypothetical protein
LILVILEHWQVARGVSRDAFGETGMSFSARLRSVRPNVYMGAALRSLSQAARPGRARRTSEAGR